MFTGLSALQAFTVLSSASLGNLSVVTAMANEVVAEGQAVELNAVAEALGVVQSAVDDAAAAAVVAVVHEVPDVVPEVPVETSSTSVGGPTAIKGTTSSPSTQSSTTVSGSTFMMQESMDTMSKSTSTTISRMISTTSAPEVSPELPTTSETAGKPMTGTGITSVESVGDVGDGRFILCEVIFRLFVVVALCVIIIGVHLIRKTNNDFMDLAVRYSTPYTDRAPVKFSVKEFCNPGGMETAL